MKHFITVGLFVSILLFFLLYTSCKKTPDGSIPNIEVNSPSENEWFALPDSIYVNCRISDSRNITSVKVQLVNEAFIPVLPAYLFYPESTTAFIELYYKLDALIVKTGIYYLQVSAENDSEFRNKYQRISITGLSPEFKQFLIITAPSDNMLQVSGLKLSGDSFPIFQVEGAYSDADISNQHQLLFLAGKNHLNVGAYDIASGEERWRIPDIPYNPMHNNNCLYFSENEKLYTSFNYQNIYGFDFTGKITFDASIDDIDAPGTIFKHRDFIMVDFQKKNTSLPFIRTYFELTGAEKQCKLGQLKVVDFFSYSNDSVVVVGNEEGSGRIYFYNVENNSESNILYFDSPIFCVTAINTQLLIVGLENSIFEINLKSSTAVKLQEGINYSVIRFEELSDQLIFVSGNQVLIYSYPEMENQKTILFSDSILDVLLNYSN